MDERERRAFAVHQGIEEFQLELNRSGARRVSKKRLAGILGVDATYLTVGHLRREDKQSMILGRLCEGLARDRLRPIATELALSGQEYAALESLAALVFRARYGYVVDHPGSLAAPDGGPGAKEGASGSVAVAIDRGLLGLELYSRNDRETAGGHFEATWEVFSEHLHALEGDALTVAVRVGTQLVGLQAYSGQKPDAVHIIKMLLERARAFKGGDRGFWEARCLLHAGAAIAYRHAEFHPERVLEQLSLADTVCRDWGLDDVHRVGFFRDRAKPLVSLGMGARMTPPRPGGFDRAIATLDASQILAGGNAPAESRRKEWLLTCLTRVECLAAMERNREALQSWESVAGQPWVPDLIGSHEMSPVYAKMAFTGIAKTLAEGGDLDEVATAAAALRSDPRLRPFGDWMHRASVIEGFAVKGERERIKRCLVL